MWVGHTASVELAVMTNIATRVEHLHIEDFIRVQIAHTAMDTQYLHQHHHNFALQRPLSVAPTARAARHATINTAIRRVQHMSIEIIPVPPAHIAHSNNIYKRI